MSNEPTTLQALAGDDWADALAAAPRERFVPDVFWTVRDGLVDRRVDAEAWANAVAQNNAITTQIVDGEVQLTAENVARNPHLFTSSCSAPVLVFDMLRLLDPYPGDQVLEIGTGTGWTAALLAAKIGASQVTSVEVDAEVASQAATSLKQAGLVPHLVVGDGTLGWPEGAPFDRVHVTCGVHTIPAAWITQTRPGGVIVVPWRPSIVPGDVLARLTVTGDTAIGRFYGESSFMSLRAQRDPFASIHGEPRESNSTIDLRRIARAGTGFEVALAGLLPGVSLSGNDIPNPTDGTYRASLRDVGSDSHAIAIQSPEAPPATVRQRGPRDLWRELETAYLTWVRLGEPAVQRLGLTVDPQGQHVWIDSPHTPITEETHG